MIHDAFINPDCSEKSSISLLLTLFVGRIIGDAITWNPGREYQRLYEDALLFVNYWGHNR
jgi:hypothetical protein